MWLLPLFFAVGSAFRLLRNESAGPPQCLCGKDTRDQWGIQCGNATLRRPFNCTMPPMKSCGKFPEMRWDKYEREGDEAKDENLHPHGFMNTIVCKEEHAPISRFESVWSWGTDQYKGVTEDHIRCNNGTWIGVTKLTGYIVRPKELFCLHMDTIKALQKMLAALDFTLEKLEEAEKIDFKWIDSAASMRMTILKESQGWAQMIFNDTLHAREHLVEEIEGTTKKMVDNRIIHRGRPFTQAECDYISQRTLYQQKPPASAMNIPPLPKTANRPPPIDAKDLEQAIPLKCSYTAQKSGIGWDFVTQKPLMFFREGCFCEANSAALCPWRNYPDYEYFGWASMDQKIVTRAAGRKAPNALCWYWSNPLHPEWGFVDSDQGKGYQEPMINSTEFTMDYLRAEAKRLKETGR